MSNDDDLFEISQQNLCHLNLSYLRNLPPDFSFLAQLLRLESLKFDYSDLDCTRLESLTISLASLHNLKWVIYMYTFSFYLFLLGFPTIIDNNS